MKLSVTKKIDDKEYKISELTVQQIITLINDASFFQKQTVDGTVKPVTNLTMKDISEDLVVSGILSQIDGFNLVKRDLENMMKVCCDFELKDLIDLAPSEIKELVTAFREVNASFLSVLVSLKVPGMLKDLWDVFLINFSERLAI